MVSVSVLVVVLVSVLVSVLVLVSVSISVSVLVSVLVLVLFVGHTTHKLHAVCGSADPQTAQILRKINENH